MNDSIAVADPPRDTNGQQVDENPFVTKATQEARKPRSASLLQSVITGKRVRPVLTVLYGGPGIGKTTWASHAPSPIFLPTERGVDQVGATRFPLPRTFEEFYKQLSALDTESHDYQTLVIDTADGLEALIWARVCAEKKVKSIEELKWGDGYTRAKMIWRGLLNQLVDMSERFNVIILAHAHVKTFNDPALPDPYEVWRIRLHDKSAEVLRECCDNILFACYDVELVKDNIKDKKGRGLHSGERIIHTQAGTGYEAKQRFDLPDPMPLEWSAFEKAINDFYAK